MAIAHGSPCVVSRGSLCGRDRKDEHFFNLVRGLKLLPEEKRDLVMFLLAL